jgi:hypothetical protein
MSDDASELSGFVVVVNAPLTTRILSPARVTDADELSRWRLSPSRFPIAAFRDVSNFVDDSTVDALGIVSCRRAKGVRIRSKRHAPYEPHERRFPVDRTSAVP